MIEYTAISACSAQIEVFVPFEQSTPLERHLFSYLKNLFMKNFTTCWFINQFVDIVYHFCSSFDGTSRNQFMIWKYKFLATCNLPISLQRVGDIRNFFPKKFILWTNFTVSWFVNQFVCILCHISWCKFIHNQLAV